MVSPSPRLRRARNLILTNNRRFLPLKGRCQFFVRKPSNPAESVKLARANLVTSLRFDLKQKSPTTTTSGTGTIWTLLGGCGCLDGNRFLRQMLLPGMIDRQQNQLKKAGLTT